MRGDNKIKLHKSSNLLEALINDVNIVDHSMFNIYICCNAKNLERVLQKKSENFIVCYEKNERTGW